MKPLFRIAVAAPLCVACWLGMMLIHECGHMLAALATGGGVERLVFNPVAFSRTDVDPNPHPALVAWAGPLFGAFAPLSLLTIGKLRRLWSASLFVAFCLLANGAYLALGPFDRAGDAADLLRRGMPLPLLLAAGILSMGSGMWQLHRLGPGLGIQRARRADLAISLSFALALIVFGLWIGR